MPRGLWYILNLLRVIQSVILKGEFEGGSRKLASGTSGREMGWQRIKSENSGDSTKIFFAIWTNIFCHLDKYIINLDKYTLPFAQVYLQVGQVGQVGGKWGGSG